MLKVALEHYSVHPPFEFYLWESWIEDVLEVMIYFEEELCDFLAFIGKGDRFSTRELAFLTFHDQTALDSFSEGVVQGHLRDAHPLHYLGEACRVLRFAKIHENSKDS